MSERDDLLISVANEIKTYRKGDLPEPTPDHVDRWLKQFTKDQQLPFLREFEHVIKQTFFTRKNVKDFLRQVLVSKKLAGSDPKAFWSSANILDIQQHGQSQSAMLRLFEGLLADEYGLELEDCGQDGGDFVYLDDVMFSGNRVGNDLEPWIRKEAPKSARVHVIVAVLHSGGSYLVDNKLKNVADEAGKTIKIKHWRSLEIENRKYYKNSSGVLWPTGVPDVDAVEAYMALPTKYPFEPREPSKEGIVPFSSEAGRQVLEREFLIAGAKIRAKSEKPKPSMRPLGFSAFGVGFGATIATYRNCPNNCPLAMWWGDPDATSGALHWYPLLQRETYA